MAEHTTEVAGDFSTEERRALDAWTAPQAPDEFADQVLKRLSAPRNRLVTRAWRVAAAAVVVALVGAALATKTLRLPSSGNVATTTRSTINLGGRATAVAEAGAE